MASSRGGLVEGSAEVITEKMAKYLRLHLLLGKELQNLLKARFDMIIQPEILKKTLERHKPLLLSTAGYTDLSHAQLDLLFPPHGQPSSATFDIPILLLLLKTSKTFTNRLSKEENHDIDSLTTLRNRRVNFSEKKKSRKIKNDTDSSLELSEVETIWQKTEQAMLRIAKHSNIPDQQQKIDKIKRMKFGRDKEGQNNTTTLKFSCKFDGRMIRLDKDQIAYLESTLKKEAQGGVGIVYRSNDTTLFGIAVVVKEINTHKNEGLRKHVRREKMVCRLMHPFILPLLAFVEKSEEKFWFIFPYCENGDLHAALKNSEVQKDEMDNNEQKTNISQTARVKILLQIALAIKYLHTEVPGVRVSILHKDIASKNVVLDKYLNARLIDFGLAREIDDVTGTAGGRIYYEHRARGHGICANERSWDYYSFGVIIREMLTSLGPEGKYKLYLKNMNKDQIEDNIDKHVWLAEEYSKLLNDLSDKCLNNSDDWSVNDFEENVVEKLKIICQKYAPKLFENGTEIEKEGSTSACHQCIINPIAKESSLTHESNICTQQIKVCMACEKNSFLNPITCYCGEKMTSTIGSRWGALLVAGDDKDQEKAEAMKKEIREIERVITSQAPRIIGIRDCKVKVVVTGDTRNEREKDGNTAWKQIQEHITKFSEDSEVDTLLIYISCHGAESEEQKNVFKLGENMIVKLDDFQKELEKLKKVDRLILILDRCFPPIVELQNKKIKLIQINACGDDKRACLSMEGSLFTRFVIQGLKARSEGKECSNDCLICAKYWDTATEYISVFTLFDYVKEHIEQENKTQIRMTKIPEPTWQLKQYWKNIAFFTDEEVNIAFTYLQQTKTLSLKYLKSFENVKDELCKTFNVNRNMNEVEIHKETFKNNEDQQIEKCDTLQKVMQAWIQRFPLTVCFPKKPYPCKRLRRNYMQV